MRVLHINDNLAAVGGIETYLLSLMPRLEQLGHEQLIAYGKGDRQLAPRGFETPEVSRAGRSWERVARRKIERIIVVSRPDVVHLHNVYNIGAIDACLENVPTVLTGHDFRYICPASSMFYRQTEQICPRRCGLGCFAVTLRQRCVTLRPKYALAYYRRVRWMFRNWQRFGRLITPSHAARDRFLQAGFPGDRSTVLPYFCPIEPLASPRPLPPRPTVLFMGRLTAIKGYKYFVHALGQLPADVRGIIIGNFTAENRQSIEQLAHSSGCVGRLELRPWADRNSIQAAMCEASVVCFPSIWPETLGIVGLESLACGVPVVASDIGGVREWLLPDETGLLAPAKDVAALAAGMRTILESPSTNERMGRAGLQLMRERFSPEGHVAELLQIYQRAGGARPTSVKNDGMLSVPKETAQGAASAVSRI